jgi:hypothetical protein
MVVRTRSNRQAFNQQEDPASPRLTKNIAGFITPPRSISTGVDTTPNQTPTRNALPLHIQRQLILDITQAGGIKKACGRTICNNKPDIYGDKTTPLRRRVQQRLTYLKKLSPVAYQAEVDYKLRDTPGKDKQESSSPDKYDTDHPPPTTPVKVYASTPHRQSKLSHGTRSSISSPHAKMSSIASSLGSRNSIFADLNPDDFRTSILFSFLSICSSYFLSLFTTDQNCFPLFLFTKLKFV